MKSPVRVELAPGAVERLETEITASVLENGIAVACPHCGSEVLVYRSPAECPTCKHGFDVVIKF